MKAIAKFVNKLTPAGLIFRIASQYTNKLSGHHVNAVRVAQGVEDQLGSIARDVLRQRMAATVGEAVQGLPRDVLLRLQLSDDVSRCFRSCLQPLEHLAQHGQVVPLRAVASVRGMASFSTCASEAAYTSQIARTRLSN